MFEGIAMFFETMMGLWRSIQTGIQIGQIMSGDVDDAFGNLLTSAHLSAWQDIIRGDGLNGGQLSMANICQDAGSEYLDGRSFNDWDANDYMSVMAASCDGASEALSHSIQKAGTAVNHVAVSTASGISGFLGDFEE